MPNSLADPQFPLPHTMLSFPLSCLGFHDSHLLSAYVFTFVVHCSLLPQVQHMPLSLFYFSLPKCVPLVAHGGKNPVQTRVLLPNQIVEYLKLIKQLLETCRI